MLGRLRDLLPAPMAAPETWALRTSRYRMIAGCTMLALSAFFFTALRDLAGRFALPLLAGALVFVLLEGLSWLIAKTRADDAHLSRLRDDAE